jgi:molybdopterin-guanine dinucleotide biosynthesis protein B
LLPLLIARGLTVSTVKHAHHGFDLDQPGKDSFRHREAGATEVMIASDRRWALMHESQSEPRLDELIPRMQHVDLVLVEGFRAHPHPKLEIHRPSLGKPPIWPGRSDIAAVATDAPLPSAPCCLDLNDPPAITDWIMTRLA